ncbi:MAG: glycine betaine catabolism [Streptomycetaceae bacterium]|nr:glycine betaine catabolism [Streptomycetaceae bacterium]
MITLVCRGVRAETDDVKSFVFEVQGPAVRYRAGQFMTFDLGGVGRCYTLSSAPTRPDRVAITVKRKPGGVVSGRLHDTMRPGDVVRASGPVGFFTLEDHPAAKYLFLTAGSGVTPLISIARALYDLAVEPDLVSVHSGRDDLFRDELAFIGRDLPGFAVLRTGERLTVGMLRAAVPDVVEREVFCCGPPGYMAAVRVMLAELGCDPARCHEESFELEPLGPVPVVGGGGFRVEFSGSGRVVECPPGGTLLEAAEAAGVAVATSCRVGLCGTCKSSLTAGRVAMDHQGGIRAREIAQGKVLLCCARPLTDLVIDR